MDSTDIFDLFDRKKIRTLFLEKYCKEQKYAPLTVKRYISSLSHFYDFVITDEVLIDKVSPEDVFKMKVIASKWSKSYNSAADEHARLRELDEQMVLITPEQIDNYEKSQFVSDALEILQRCRSNRCIISKTEFTCVRDYLLTQITVFIFIITVTA